MKTTATHKEWAKKGLYVGTGAGIILFALVGLLPGSFIGGFLGLKVVGVLFGGLEATVISRVIVALSMLTGVLVSAVAFVFGSGVLGWAAGYVADTLSHKAGDTVGEATRA
jgi:hypothetical protein